MPRPPHGSFLPPMLVSRDPAAAQPFYTELFGWTARTVDLGGRRHVRFLDTGADGGSDRGGLMQMDADWGGAPSRWMPYVAVDDADGAAERVVALGGEIVVTPVDLPGVGRYVLVTDPAGAPLALLQTADGA